MSTCRHCGQQAGFLRWKHAACRDRYNAGKQKIVELATGAFSSTTLDASIPRKVDLVRRDSFISVAEQNLLISRVWSETVARFLDDGIVSHDEEARLSAFQQAYGLTQQDLDRDGAYSRLAKSAVIRDVLEGKIPNRITVAGTLPVNLQKGESIVWLFRDASYLEDKTRREFVGSSSGLSFRVAKGVYYRVGAFKGHPIEKTHRTHVDSGAVVVTNKNIYFSGPKKSLRVPYAKIVSFQPFSDGVGIIRDAQTAKPQIFVTGDGWFTYNLVANLAQIN